MPSRQACLRKGSISSSLTRSPIFISKTRTMPGAQTPEERPRKRGPKRGNGEGSITKDERGRWVARVSIHGTRRKFIAATKNEALDRMNAWKAAQGYVKRGEYLKTVADVLGAWLHHLRLTGARESTVERCYGSKVRLHLLPALGPVEVAKLDSDRVLMALRGARRFRHSGREGDAAQETRQPLSPRSVQMCWVILKAACNWAVKEHKLPTNPLAGKRGPKVEKAIGASVRAWPPEHVQAFLSTAKGAAEDATSPEAKRSFQTLHALWTLLLTSGLR